MLVNVYNQTLKTPETKQSYINILYKPLQDSDVTAHTPYKDHLPL